MDTQTQVRSDSLFAQAVALGTEIAGIPGLDTAVSIVKQILAAYNGVKHKRGHCGKLVERSETIIQVIEQNWKPETAVYRTDDMQRLIAVLEEIKLDMDEWATYHFFDSWIRQSQISATVDSRMRELDSCLEAFNVASHIRLQAMVQEIRKALGRDGAFQTMMREHSQDQDQLIIMAGELQKLNRSQTLGSNAQIQTRGRILDIQRSLYGGLPNTDLKSKTECEKVGAKPAIIAKSHEIWEGKWMGSQKVALKVLRELTNDEADRTSKMKKRLNREANIWSLLRNEYIVPLYGVCTDDGPYPYLVMPWYQHGNAKSFLEYKLPAIRFKICLDAARGLQYLHSLKRPVVHGNLRGSNILVSDDERGLLSDFGFSNTSGSEHSTTLASDNLRWMSFEAQQGVRTPDIDVWAWAMTVLELVTEKVPYHKVKMTGRLAMMIQDGERPKQEDHQYNGMDNNLWSLLESCWKKPDKRAKIDEVVRRMEAITGAGAPRTE
ncbi:hypothetical protein BOTBODRAFT_59005 [Botryobasidium botryosum FD-172 SS1]|uniref:Protein kinase domain-containing protein n=1 Tax=Botryobasidium botryosum (strain FD-172 SS1) TaxID=930990 RepID=A0A067M2M5_BOTB1|nr:hypothetical protein BOTBODRAFT_59005 [Botryobasidium botryosum FD-172 SS1]